MLPSRACSVCGHLSWWEWAGDSQIALPAAALCIIIPLSHEALRLGSQAGDQPPHRLEVVQGEQASRSPRPLPTGIIVVEEPNPEGRTVLYARVSSADQEDDLQRPQAFARQKDGRTLTW